MKIACCSLFLLCFTVGGTVMAVMQERHTGQAQMSVVPYSDENYADIFFSLQKPADSDPKQVNSDLMQTIRDMSKKDFETEKSENPIKEKKHVRSDISGMRSGKLTDCSKTYGKETWKQLSVGMQM